MKIAHAAQTDVGLVRAGNEDYFRVAPEIGLFVLADGMGGARGGGFASQLAAETVAKRMLQVNEPDASALLAAVEEAHDRVREEAAQNPALNGMGTTIVALLTNQTDVAIVSVGDSRAYRYGLGTLDLLTEDQTWVREVGIPLGLTEAALRTHPMRNRLTMAVGIEAPLESRYYGVPLPAGYGVLLSTDGLHGLIEDEKISEVVNGCGSLEERCALLIQAAKDAGGTDNITAVMVEAV